jgi:hypothetical protein
MLCLLTSTPQQYAPNQEFGMDPEIGDEVEDNIQERFGLQEPNEIY